MPTVAGRAAIPVPVAADNNNVPADMTALANRVDAVFAMSKEGLISARPTTADVRSVYWASDDRGGKLWYGDAGGAWHEIGPSPWTGPTVGSQTALLQAPTIMGIADPVEAIRGKTGQTGDLTRWQDPTGVTTLAKVSSTGAITTPAATVTGATATGTLSTTGLISEVLATAATVAQSLRVTGDTQDRWNASADGTTKWGPGGAAVPDTSMYRTAAGTLRIDTKLGINISNTSYQLDVSGPARISGALTLTTPLAVGQGGTGSATQNFVDLSTAQTVAGIKTFSSAPVVPTNSFPESAVTNLVTDLAARAIDTTVVHLAGAETISGAKTFSASITANNGATVNGAVVDVSSLAVTDASAGTGVGDKIGLHGSGYGFGVQANHLVAYAPGGAFFAVRQIAGAGQRSSNTSDAVSLGVDGQIFAAGASRRLHVTHDGTFTYLYGEDTAGSSANGNLYLQSGSIYNRILSGSGEYRIWSSGGATLASVSNNGQTYFGNTRLNDQGSWPTLATFMHNSMAAGTQYALMQDSTSATYLNAGSGASVYFRNANTTKASVSDIMYLNTHIQMNRNTIYTDTFASGANYIQWNTAWGGSSIYVNGYNAVMVSSASQNVACRVGGGAGEQNVRIIDANNTIFLPMYAASFNTSDGSMKTFMEHGQRPMVAGAEHVTSFKDMIRHVGRPRPFVWNDDATDSIQRGRMRYGYDARTDLPDEFTAMVPMSKGPIAVVDAQTMISVLYGGMTEHFEDFDNLVTRVAALETAGRTAGWKL